MQAQAAQMRQFEEVLIQELKMQEEERVILRHTADTVKQVSVQCLFFVLSLRLVVALCSEQLRAQET